MSNIIEQYQKVAPQPVLKAVQFAAEKTGVDFSFLMEKAAAESNFDPKAAAKTSSAKGLYQFIESTWLGMVKEHGDKYGLGEFAKHVEVKDGKHCVGNCDVEDQILALRDDPKVAALMAGEFSAANKEYLQKHTNGDVGKTELYLAHFMGAGGATKFLNAMAKNEDQNAAALFSKAAKANKNVFFDRKTGQPRTLKQVYNFFDKKFNTTQQNVPDSKMVHPPKISAPVPQQLAVTAAPARTSTAPSPYKTVPQALPPFSDLPSSRLTSAAWLMIQDIVNDLPRSGFSSGGYRV